jgi:hypothetical protein
VPARGDERTPVLRLLDVDVRGQLELDRHASGQVQDPQEARALVSLDHLAAKHRPAVAPPLRHRRVARGARSRAAPATRAGARRATRAATHVAERARGNQGRPDSGRWSDTHRDCRHPDRCRGPRAGTDRGSMSNSAVRAKRPRTAGGNAVGQVEQEAVARARPQITRRRRRGAPLVPTARRTRCRGKSTTATHSATPSSST